MALAQLRPAAQDARNQNSRTGEGVMITDISIRRRTFLGGVAALGAAHGFGTRVHAALSPSVANLPARRHVVIRDAYVMSMEPGEADLPKGDVHVDNGLIVDIGTELAAPGAEVI